MMKKGKEIKLGKTYMNYKVISGTVDSKNPTSVYINISAWGEPTNDNVDEYVSVISSLKKDVKAHVFANLPLTFNKQRTIVDLDMRESGIAYGKRSYMSCEITLYQNHRSGKLLMADELKKSMVQITDNVIKEVFDKYPHFKFHKKKS
jgi:hypothetical protein